MKRLPLLTLSAILALSMAPECLSADNNDSLRAQVAKMEKAVFGQSSNAKPLVQRVGALEKEAFSRTHNGTLKQRVEELSKTVGVGAEPTRPAVASQLPPVAPGFKKSQAPFAPVMSRSPEVIRAKLLEAIRLHQDGKEAGAEKCFREILAVNPYDPDACFSMGSICEAHGDLVSAMGYYRTAAMANPDDQEARDAVAAMEERISLKQGPFINPLSGTPVLQARASEFNGINNTCSLQPADIPLAPLVAAPMPTGYVGSRPHQIPTLNVGQNPQPNSNPQSSKAAFARGVARVAARTALQYSPLHCPMCQLLRF